MTALIEALIGRLPIGWLQLRHNKARLVAAVAGVAFACILVLMQFGFFFALIGTIAVPYQQMNGDILLSAADMNTLTDGGPLPRQRMYEALAVEGVGTATPLYYGKIDWKQTDGTIRALDVFGIDPSARPFRTVGIDAQRSELMRQDVALIDDKTRKVVGPVFEGIAPATPYRFEAKGRTLSVTGTFTIGGGVSTDGYLVVSDQTFLRLFPQRLAGAPNHILITVAPGASVAAVEARLRARLPAYDTVVRTTDEAARRDISFQTTQKPVGIVFGFGVIMGVLVGTVIVYQVLASDVADHMREYATFKAIGYRQRFFIGVIAEEAVLLALFGFVPGLLVAMALYAVVARAAALPIEMTVLRAVIVFVGTVVMCTLSGAIAARRLARADPADLF